MEDHEVAGLKFVVQTLRQVRGLSQRSVAKEVGVDQGTLSAYETGDSVPDEEFLRRLAAAVRVPWHLVVHLRRFFGSFAATLNRQDEVGADPADDREDGGLDYPALEREAVDAVRLALVPFVLDEEDGPLGDAAGTRDPAPN